MAPAITSASPTGATVAVAANFFPTARVLADVFAREHGAILRLSSGSTGKLYAQIVNGAPYDIFLAADALRPQLLVKAGHAAADSRFTYAHGQLVLVARVGMTSNPRALLESSAFRRLALANPKLAPYGLASMQVLKALNLWQVTRPQRVLAENVGQVWAMFATGNVELAFVGRSQLLSANVSPVPPHWLVPSSRHAPIRQDAVQLVRSEANQVATRFLAFLRSPAARARIEQAGYELPGT